MRRRSWSSALVALTGALPFAAAATTLHWPLPPDSLERNGEPQHKVSHVHLPNQHHKISPLPDRGLHPNAALGLKRPYTGYPVNVLRYHNDNYPTGWNSQETDLTPTNVHSARFGQLTTLNVDSNVFAQPLMVSNFQMADNTTHNVLLVATGHNTVIAYDAQNYAILWQRTLGKSQSTNDVGCGDVQPEYGISSTPVIVRTAPNAATVYLVAGTEPAPFSFHTKIHALDLRTGKDLVTPVEIAPYAHLSTGGSIHFDPQNQWNRASLAYNNGSIYVGIGSHCDNNAGSISGWMLRYDTNLNLTAKFNTIEGASGYELSSIWMAGYSPAIDASGNVFAITGNGLYNLGKGPKGYGESVLSFPLDLSSATTFTPKNYQDLNNGDVDFGSGALMLIPPSATADPPPLAVALGKASTLYLLNAADLGGLEGTGTLPLQQFQSGGGCWCGPAYFQGPRYGIVYYQAGWDVLHAYKVAATSHPHLVEVATGTSEAGFGGSFPVVSSNGLKYRTGIVWLVRRGDPVQLEAYDALTLGDPIFQSNAGGWNGTEGVFLSPLVANGRVYVPAYKSVTVFGLTG